MIREMKKPSLFLALAPLFFTGCALSPVDKKPDSTPPASWTSKTEKSDSPVASEWWRDFGDKRLDETVAKALASSPDLDAAYARVRASRAAAGLADSGFWPTFGMNSAYSRQHYSDNILSRSSKDQTVGNYTVGGGLNYEVDLWGRVANESDAATADYRASHAALEKARQLVAGEIVRIWFGYDQAKVERTIVADELKSREETLELLRARQEAGMIADDDVERAALDVARSRSDLTELERSVANWKHALAAAVGADAIAEPDGVMPVNIPAVPVSLPADAVRARPDIAVADLRLDAALLREGVARANYYPNVTLSATGGFTSINAGDFIAKGSRFWSFGPTVSLPIFTGGANDAKMEASRARYDEAVSTYRRTLLDAFRETEDALVNVARLAEQEKHLIEVKAAAERVYDFTKARYDGGLSSNLRVIIAERDALAARRDTARVRFERLRATASLALALGGGWHRDEIEKSAEKFEAKLAGSEAKQ